jgi:uncharacterized protein YraI
MSKIALATSVVALIAAASFVMGRAEAQPPASYLAPGAVPPWANSTPWSNSTTATTVNATTATTTPAATPAAAPAAVPGAQLPEPAELGTTTPIQVVSLRAGPNRDAPVIGTLHPGDQLEILARANYGWTEVRSSAGTGWAYGSYLASGIGPVAGVSGNVIPTSAAPLASNPAQATPLSHQSEIGTN